MYLKDSIEAVVIAGLLTCFLARLATADVPVLLTPIALVGDAAAGLEDVVYTSYPIWSRSSSDGRLTWQADLSNGQEGIWVYDVLGSRPIALAGPGAEYESFYNQGSGFINSLGQVTLVSERGADQDIVVIDGESKTIVLSTDEQAPGLAPGISISPGSVGVSISDGGIVSFRRTLDGPGITTDNDNSWWIGPVNNPQVLLREGDPAPGLPGDQIGGLVSGFSKNDAGYAAVPDSLQSGRRAIWAGVPGDVQLVASEGAPVPGFPEQFFGSFINQLAQVSSSNEVVFRSRIVDASSQPVGDALFVGGPGNLSSVLATGDPSPFGEGETIQTIGTPSLNRVGKALVTATLESENGNTRGVLMSFDLDDPMDASLIVEVGDIAPGTDTAITSLPGGYINDRGDVLFSARLAGFGPANFGHGYWLKPADRPTQVVSFEGQTIDFLEQGKLVQRDLRTSGIPTGLSEMGTVGVLLSFEQGGGGLFLAQINPIPEPSTSILLVVAVSCVALLRRR
ncbi:DUF7453 family protein [Aeoliella mucimassa]|uniref:DUF7453 family protein n=1 Tax=Aeoliella mucimassa TaxID=2527972 RepID=UPI0018D4A4A4|nr:choice-of-anchor tandem repeat NxxGxxAF-containing protein [Aeoliella mucimassa]